MEAVESVYAGYRDVVVKQYCAAQPTPPWTLRTAAPRPESRVRFADSGLEITLRFPVSDECGWRSRLDSEESCCGTIGVRN